MKETYTGLALREPVSLACRAPDQFEYAAQKLWTGLGLTLYGACVLLYCILRTALCPGSLTLWRERPEEIAKGESRT